MVKMGERTSSFWPLPGGYRNYLETLRNLLGRIAEEPAFDDLVEWASKILDTESGWLRNSIRIVIIYSDGDKGFSRENLGDQGDNHVAWSRGAFIQKADFREMPQFRSGLAARLPGWL